jgi:prevent-host-death family protein
MEQVGVRDLRQRASEVLRRVEGGESFEVTDRGRPVAVLVKFRPPGLDRLEAEGRLRRGVGDPLDVTPIRLKPGEPLPSRLVGEARGE